MKSCLLLLLLLAAAGSYAQTTNGYIVTLQNDTLPVEIKLPKNFLKLGYKLHKKVEIRDSVNNVKEYLPGEIKAFGYTDKSGSHIYATKPGKDGAIYFLELIWEGKHTNFYQYIVKRQDYSVPAITTGAGIQSPGFHSLSSDQEFYTFERFDRQYLFLSNHDSLEDFKKKLTEFYASNITIRRVIFQRFMSRKDIQIDIKTVLMLANK